MRGGVTEADQIMPEFSSRWLAEADTRFELFEFALEALALLLVVDAVGL